MSRSREENDPMSRSREESWAPDSDRPGSRSGRRADPVGIVFAVLFLAVAVSALGPDPLWLFTHWGKWIVCGVVALIGVVLLLSAARQRD